MPAGGKRKIGKQPICPSYDMLIFVRYGSYWKRLHYLHCKTCCYMLLHAAIFLATSMQCNCKQQWQETTSTIVWQNISWHFFCNSAVKEVFYEFRNYKAE